MFSDHALSSLSYSNCTTILKGSQDDSLSLSSIHFAVFIVVLVLSLSLAKSKAGSSCSKDLFQESCSDNLQESHVSPPCEKIIEEAERRNRRNGHENCGFLSKDAGFSPRQTVKAFPPSHAVWDQLAADLPRLVQTQTVRETVIKMPTLDASPEALPNVYLQRAATILGMTAHVFVRMEGSEPLTLKYDGHSEILPPSLEIPWTIVCKRLGRPGPALTYVDGVVANFISTALSYRDVTLDNLQLLVPTVGTKEERIFVGVMLEINAKTIPILHQVIEAQRSVLAQDSSALKDAIRNLHALLKDVTKIFAKLNTNRVEKGHIDPVLWTLTVANLGIPWVKGAVGAAGTAHPFFHMMDEFTGRSEYNTGMGKEAQIVRATYPIHWRQFLEAVAEVSVTEYIAVSKDENLKNLWTSFTSAYHGNDGLLGFHRRKVFGFLAVSFRIGRSTTINGLGHKRKTEPWQEVDQELENARLERGCHDSFQCTPEPEGGFQKIFVSQLIRHNSKEDGYWFSASRSVYDASAFMQKHPGGDTVIALCSGQDVTDSLKAVGHLRSPSTRNKLETYQIGTLVNPDFRALQAKEVYMAAVELGQKAAEMENVYRANFQLLDGKLTLLDRPGVLTPKKKRHLLDAKNRFQKEHVPALATLLDALLDRIADSDMVLDLSDAHAKIHGLVSSEREFIAASKFSNYSIVMKMLRADLGRLTEVKELVATLLETLEDTSFASSERSRLTSIVGILGQVASQLMVLAGN